MSQDSCQFCNGTGWVNIRVDPIPPWSDLMSVDQDIDPCWLCNPNGFTSDYFDLSDEIQDQIPYYLATAIGGFDGQYGLLQNFVDGVLVRSLILDRSMFDYDSWRPPLTIENCPVCHGWGIWSDNGQIQDCIACGGQPVKARQGFEPLYAWWINWQLGHSVQGPINLYTPRGVPSMDQLAENRQFSPVITDSLVSALEQIPGVTRIN